MAVDINKLFNYWYKEADYSWEVTVSLLEKKKYAEALFFGHLTVEKLLKALVVFKQKTHAPPIHNLIELIKKTDVIYDKNQLDDLGMFNNFYLAGRYDNYKMNFRKQCTKKFTEDSLTKIKQYYLWLKKEAKNKSHLL